MSELPSPGQVEWHSRLKFSVIYPSELDAGQQADDGPSEFILAVINELSGEGIGYLHEDINGMTNWGLGKKTKPPPSKTGLIVASETEWVYKLLRWLAASNERFDIKVIELENEQNPYFGQWAGGQESYIGCYVDPISKSAEIGEMPYASIPFSWTIFKFSDVSGGQVVRIGEGLFSAAGLPPSLPGASV